MNAAVSFLEEPAVRWALQSVASVTVTCLVALAVGRLVRHSAVVRVWVYSTALAVCLVAPLASLAFLGTGRALIAVPILGPAETAGPAPLTLVPKEATMSVSEPSLVTEDGAQFVPVPEQAPRTETALPLPTPSHTFDFAGLVAALYVGGLTLAVAKLGAGAAAVRRIVLLARPATAEEGRLFRGSPRPWPFHRTLVSSTLDAPVVTGAFRPVLVLPEGFGTDLSPTEIEQIVAHEAEHARSCHLMTGLLARAVAAVHWFNPLVGLVRRRLNRAMEEQCDNASLAHGTREEFAKLLVSLAEGSRRLPTPGLAMSVMDPRFPLEQRIRGLFDPDRRTTTTMKPTTRIVVLGASVAGCLLLAGTQMVAAQAQDVPPGAPTETVIVQGEPSDELTVTGQDGQRYVLRPVRQAKKAGKRAARTKVRYVLTPIERPDRAAAPTAPYIIVPRSGEPVPTEAPAGQTYRVITDGQATVAAPAGAPTVSVPRTHVQWATAPSGSDVGWVRAEPNTEVRWATAPSGDVQWVVREGGSVPSGTVRSATAPSGTRAAFPSPARSRMVQGTGHVLAAPAAGASMTVAAPAFAGYRVATVPETVPPTTAQDPFSDRDREYFQRASEMLDGERSKTRKAQSDPLSKPAVRVERFRTFDPLKSLESLREIKPASQAAKLDRLRIAQTRGLSEVESKRLALELGEAKVAERLARRDLEKRITEAGVKGRVAAEHEVARSGQDRNLRIADREAKALVERELTRARGANTRGVEAKRLADLELARAKAAKAVQTEKRKPYRVIEGATVIIYEDGTTEIRPPAKSKTAKSPKAKVTKTTKPKTGNSGGR